MTLKAKNKSIYSYVCEQLNQSNFIYKDFNKTSSYNSKFDSCSFTGTSFRSAAFKHCTFVKCKFNECDFVGTNFFSSKFINCSFTKCFLLSCKTKNTKFDDCSFINNVLCPSMSVGDLKKENTIYNEFPKESSFDIEILEKIQKFKSNEFINRSRVIFRGSKLNTLVLNELLKQFGKEKIINSIDIVSSSVHKDFYTISYLFKILNKS